MFDIVKPVKLRAIPVCNAQISQRTTEPCEFYHLQFFLDCLRVVVLEIMVLERKSPLH